MTTVGVVVMAYGTPRDRADIAAYYTDIRRGRPPSETELAALVERYDAIGGTFPLRAISEAQRTAIAAALTDHGDYVVELGYKHAEPRIEDAVRELVRRGASRLVGLVLAPHYSGLSVGEYAERAAAVAREAGTAIETIESWHLLPAYVDFLARGVRHVLATMPSGSEVVFTAHSLPRRILDIGDPYRGQLAETASAVAAVAGLAEWSVAWQSAGRTPEPWLGPDVVTVLRERAAVGVPGLVMCPCGFIADHLEVSYDLDIEVARVAQDLGIAFARTPSVNADPSVMRALAELIAGR